MFTRAPPPQGAPPSYAFATRVYGGSLRPIVAAASFLSAVWSLIWGIASFRDISIDKNHAVRLEVFDIVLGSLYMGALAVEILGMVASWLERLVLIRMYAFLSLGGAAVITGTELLRVIIHFVYKNTLINECTQLATGDTITSRFGIWGPSVTTTLDGQDAHDLCDSAWRHDSFSEIAWFIVVGILSLLFAAIAFSYYRQMLDPTSPVNAARAPSAQARAAGLYPEHYNPPYVPESDYYGNARGPGTGTGRYAPPPGPPPGAAKADDEAYVPEYDPAKLPEYDVRGAYTAGASDKKSDAVDPFADFDELGKKAPAHESDSEHDDGAKHT